MLRCATNRQNTTGLCDTLRPDDVPRCPTCGNTRAHWEPTLGQIRESCEAIRATWSPAQTRERLARAFRPRLLWPILARPASKLRTPSTI